MAKSPSLTAGTSLGDVLFPKFLAVLARRAASFAFAIWSRRASDEVSPLLGVAAGFGGASDRREAFAFAICSRRADDELDTLRPEAGVSIGIAMRPGVGVSLGIAILLFGDGVNSGDLGCVKIPPRDGRAFGVLAIMVLLFESGRSLGVFWAFSTWDSGCFFTVDTGLEMEGTLLGVERVGGCTALTLLFPGAVRELFGIRLPKCRGVVGLA